MMQAEGYLVWGYSLKYTYLAVKLLLFVNGQFELKWNDLQAKQINDEVSERLGLPCFNFHILSSSKHPMVCRQLLI